MAHVGSCQEVLWWHDCRHELGHSMPKQQRVVGMTVQVFVGGHVWNTQLGLFHFPELLPKEIIYTGACLCNNVID